VEQLAHIEESLKVLWEKVRRAGDVIAQLREERQALQAQVALLQQEVAKLRNDLAAKEQQLQRTAAGAQEMKAAAIISNGERAQLAAKVKELLARIDAYL
jgi:chromosome segregation ATPase